ncbi:MAG: phage Gp37/Gp68 family protein [Firmicutes bacterium]|nr:phage Gp37/Gp68 family protein [Bacillota bacterium]
MAAKTKIEWTENTWNPVTGCTKISDGCRNCYAYTLANRLKLMGNQKYSNGFNVTLHEYCLHDPLKWKKPSLVFVNSMSDLFHKDIPLEFIKKVFDVMNEASRHTFQILTKRHERLAELAVHLNWTPNIWQGVTVESSKYIDRIEYLKMVPAKVHFVSFEPLIGEVTNIDFEGIDWAIVGGESGFGARVMKEEWVLSIKEECENQGVPFYFKQWGGVNKKKSGRLLLGKTWDAMPLSV